MAVSVEAHSSRVTQQDQVIAEATGLAKDGHFGRSLDIVDEALREEPRNRDLLYTRALTLLDWGRLNEASAGLRAAKEAGLSSFGLSVNLFQVCQASGLTDEAAQHALQAIALDDAQAAGHLCLAVVHQARKRYAEAIECYERGYALAPERVDCLWEIASCLLDEDDATRAETVARRAIAVHGEDHARSWALLASALAMQKRWDEAMATFERAEAIEERAGRRREVFGMHAFQLFSAGRLEAATALYRRYLPACPDPGPHAHYGLLLLTAGRLREAWAFYEFRWTFDKLLAIRPRLGRPEWRGQELAGKRLLLWAEQGVGDVVQFVRLASAFKEKDATVLLHVPERLKEFARCFRDVDRVVSEPAEFADGFDYHLSLMSASGALGIDLESIPNDVPYITVDEDRKRRWRERLAAPGLLRVGLAWAGNPTHEHDHLRSIALARLAPLFAVRGIRFYSLQKEPRPDDAGALPPGAALIDLALELADFRDTAAAIEALDLVVAVDTAVVHIAGALAKPAWVMLQTPPDFRWLMEGDDSPWYPTLRLFRQRVPNEWDEVIADVREALAEAVRAWHADPASVELGPVAARKRRTPTAGEPPIPPLCGIADTRYGIVQFLRRDEPVARSLEFYGEWLQPQLDVVVATLKPGSAVIEAGSGVGAHTLALAKQVGPAGSVFAYEPDAARARVLFQNLQMNRVRSQVTLMERRLVGSSPAGGLTENRDTLTARGADACDTVDELALSRLDLLKINSTRSAGGILEGARDTLCRLRPTVIVASDREHVSAIAEKIESFGYRCWRIVTPYFSATNHSGRGKDIFDGGAAMALVGVPEDSVPPALLDEHEEVSGPDAGSAGRQVVLAAAGETPRRTNAMRRWVRVLSRRRNSTNVIAETSRTGGLESASDSKILPRLADPAVAASRYYAAARLLMRGDYERGFDLYESRFDAFEERAAPARKFERSLGVDRRWRGGPLPGRRIVIWCEQGFGDSVMMLRYLPLLKAQGATKVMVVCERELVALVQAMPAVDRVFSGNDVIAPGDFDLQCPFMSLPHGFRTTWSTVPKDVPYVTLPKDRVERWRERLSAIDGAKIGLAWAGGETLEADSRRSIPLVKFEPLFRVPGVRFVSLQKDRRLDDMPAAFPLIDWMSECGDFFETASLTEALDLVISVDTAVAHLAGALGKKVWLLNRHESEWRWGRGLTRTPWYPTMTIFNQRNPARWEDIVEDVAEQLNRTAGEARSAAPAYRTAPEDFDGLLQSGTRRLQQGDAKAAEAKFRDAIRVRDDSARAWDGLGVALALQERHAEAQNALRRAGELEDSGGDACDSFVNLANSLASEGRVQDALAVYRTNLPARPNPQGHHNYALTLLTAGELIEGWRHYEFRWMVEPLRSLRPRYPQPEWAGQDLRDKTILLHCEQGFGDTIQFVRYAGQLKALGARVVLSVQPELMQLARGFTGLDAVVDSTRELAFDYYIPLLSLPRVFGTDLSSIPVEIPYVRPDPERQNRWQEWLGGEGGPKVGAVWAGSRTHSRDRSRSVPLSVLQPLLETAGIRFYSFQKSVDAYPAERATSNGRLIDLGPRLADFADTAAALSNMDLMVCVDTSVAHLAAALGRPVWLMLPRPADFRWLEDREDSPWYPTMRLFRQTKRDDWSDVVERVKAALREWAGQTHSGTLRTTEPRTMPVARVPLPSAETTIVKAGHRPGLTAVAQTRAGVLQYLPDEPIVGDSIAWYGEYLQPQLDLLARVVRNGAVFAEVGSGVGAHAISLARIVGETGSVHVYESRTIPRRILQQNLSASGVRNVKELRGRLPKSSREQGEVREASIVEPLDELRLERLDCLKIGAGEDALDVLAGASDTLWRLRPLLFTAASDERLLHQQAERAREFGYRCWRMETALFNPRNFNRRDKDIFGGRTTLALVALPEETNWDVALDGCSEIS